TLLLPIDFSAHTGHSLVSHVNDEQLAQPSRLLTPLTNNHAEAQFFFTPSVVGLVLTTAKRLGYRSILCVGTPRVHEAVNSDRRFRTMKSFLVDYDYRFVSRTRL